MSDYLDPNNEELLKDFFAEAEQQVETLESNILIIESGLLSFINIPSGDYSEN